MNIFLVYPPFWTPTMPHLAVPWLTGFMRQNGHTVFQRDLNAEFFDDVLTRRHLQRSLKRTKKRFGAPGAQRASALNARLQAARPDPDLVRWAREKGPMLAEKVEKAKAVMRSQPACLLSSPWQKLCSWSRWRIFPPGWKCPASATPCALTPAGTCWSVQPTRISIHFTRSFSRASCRISSKHFS